MGARTSRRSHRSEQQRQRWSQIAIGVFLVLLMVLSIAQVSLNQDDGTTLAFGTTKFTRGAEGFTAKIAGVTHTYDFVPYSNSNGTLFFQNVQGGTVVLRHTPGAGQLLRDASFIALTFDPSVPATAAASLDYARFQLRKAFEGKALQTDGVIMNNSAYPDFPVIDCPSATTQIPVIKLVVANTTTGFANVTLNGTCLTILGDRLGIVAAKDYLLLAKDGVISDG